MNLKCNGISFDNFLKQVNNTLIKGNFMILVKTILKTSYSGFLVNSIEKEVPNVLILEYILCLTAS